MVERISISQLVAEAACNTPSILNDDHKISHIMTNAEAICRDKQAATERAVIDSYRHHFSPAQLAMVTEMATKLKDVEFRHGQQRKQVAGKVFEGAWLEVFGTHGVQRPPKKNPSYDFALSDNGQLLALLSLKHTTRERWRGEKHYSAFVGHHNLPHFIVTNDKQQRDISQHKIDAMIADGFIVVLRDELVGKFKASDNVIGLSQLAARLHRLKFNWQQYLQAA